MHLRGLVAEAEGVLGLVEERTLSSMLGRETCDASKDAHGVLVRVARKGVTGLLTRRLLAVSFRRMIGACKDIANYDFKLEYRETKAL